VATAKPASACATLFAEKVVTRAATAATVHPVKADNLASLENLVKQVNLDNLVNPAPIPLNPVNKLVSKVPKKELKPVKLVNKQVNKALNLVNKLVKPANRLVNKAPQPVNKLVNKAPQRVNKLVQRVLQLVQIKPPKVSLWVAEDVKLLPRLPHPHPPRTLKRTRPHRRRLPLPRRPKAANLKSPKRPKAAAAAPRRPP